MLKRLLAPRRVPQFTADMESEFVGIAEQVRPYTMTSIARQYALYSAVRYVTAARIPGAIVECGVWRGGSSMLTALTLTALNDSSRELWLYDTFEGMTAPDDRDVRHDGSSAIPEWQAGRRGNGSAWCYADEEDVRANMGLTNYPRERVHYVKGPVEQTIPGEAPPQIGILRLDTDWYASTRHELEHLYPRLAPGGVLLIDDYGHWQGCRKAVDEYFAGQAVLLQRIDETGRLLVKPH